MAARKPATEFVSEAPEVGAGLVLADNVHFKGEVFLRGSKVSELPEALKAHVLRNEELAVKG